MESQELSDGQRKSIQLPTTKSFPDYSNFSSVVSHGMFSPVQSPIEVSKIVRPTMTDFTESREVSQIMSTGNNSGGGSMGASGAQLPATKKKLTQDSEDSSYDSDCEVSDGTHYDVSRTVSDTLAQEFAEYVTLSSSSSGNLQSTFESANQEQVKSFPPPVNSVEYTSRLEFAKKLGYSESQVQIALSKLGPCPSQNELLNELILLDSVNPASSLEAELLGGESSSKKGATPLRGALGKSNSGASGVIDSASLRHIVIDGSNVAMSHGNNKVFSCRGIQIAVGFFRTRGHTNITVFVPSYRKEASKPDDPVTDQHILNELEKSGVLVYTPSRMLNNRRLICYDDRYILKLAVDVDGIVVSNDNYRDLTIESNDFKRIVEERILMYSFVNDRFMPPEDPLGRNGPTLDQFLSKTPIPSAPPCPYGRKCTYGQKCKYYHSTQQKSVSETLRKQAAMKTQSVPTTRSSQMALPASHLMPVTRTKSAVVPMESSDNPLGGSTNPHRKLQRQLSINPGGDPRIRGSMSGLHSPQRFDSGLTSGSNPGSTTYLHAFPGNPHLSEVWSPPGIGPTTSLSTGEVNLTSSNSSATRFPSPIGVQGNATGPSSSNVMDNRTQMYYHLSAIFPEHQVRHVMNLYPEENEPGLICRAIVSIFK